MSDVAKATESPTTTSNEKSLASSSTSRGRSTQSSSSSEADTSSFSSRGTSGGDVAGESTSTEKTSISTIASKTPAITSLGTFSSFPTSTNSSATIANPAKKTPIIIASTLGAVLLSLSALICWFKHRWFLNAARTLKNRSRNVYRRPREAEGVEQASDWRYIEEQAHPVVFSSLASQVLQQSAKARPIYFTSDVATAPDDSVNSVIVEIDDSLDAFAIQECKPAPLVAAHLSSPVSEDLQKASMACATVEQTEVATLRRHFELMQREMASLRAQVVDLTEGRMSEEGPPLYFQVVASREGGIGMTSS